MTAAENLLPDSLSLPSKKMKNTVEYKRMSDLLGSRKESDELAEHWNDDEDDDDPLNVPRRGNIALTITVSLWTQLI